MSALLRSLATLLVMAAVACASTQKPVEASSTVEVVEEAPADAGTQSPLQPVASTEGFQVAMPPSPAVSQNTVKIPAGEVGVSSYSVRDESGVLYVLNTADYPPALVSKATADTFLSEGRKGVVQQLTNAKVVSEEPLTLQGYPGTQYVVQSDNGELRGRNFLVGNRLYTLFTLYNPAVGAPNTDAFFNSLQLINPPPSVARESVGAADGGAPADGGMAAPGATDAGTATPRTDGGIR